MNLSGSDTMLQFPGEFCALLGVALLFVLLAVLAPRWSDDAFDAVARPFTKLAQRRVLVLWLLFFAVVSVRLAILPLLPILCPASMTNTATCCSATHWRMGGSRIPPTRCG